VADTGLVGVSSCALAWGDYNNDGKLDLTASGATGINETGPLTRVYTGAGNGTFTTAQTLTGQRSSSAAWGTSTTTSGSTCWSTGTTPAATR
jgi:hypothetical protein